MNFSYKDKVRITEGFYTGYTGVVTGYKKEKNNTISYTVKIESKDSDINKKEKTFKEDELKKVKSILLFGFLPIDY